MGFQLTNMHRDNELFLLRPIAFVRTRIGVPQEAS